MEKLTYLYNLEFKRNKSFYKYLILFANIFLVIALAKGLNYYNTAIELGIQNIGEAELINLLGNTNFSSIIKGDVTRIYIVGLAICIFYSFAIWSNDINKKSNVIYTLMMIPENRMKIYIAKLLNILTFVYMYMTSFITVLFIFYKICGFIIKDSLYNQTNFYNDVVVAIHHLPKELYTFMFGYVLLLTAIIFFIFTFVLIQKIGNMTLLKKIVVNIGIFLIVINAWVVTVLDMSYPSKFIISILSGVTILICSVISNDILKNRCEF